MPARRAAGTAKDAHAVFQPQDASGRPESRKTTTDRCAAFTGPQTLILDGYPSKDQQELLGPNRGSRRWGVAEERSNVQQRTGTEARRQGIRPVPAPAHVTYCFVVPDGVRRDWDNYALICKPVQDGLVKAGILVGDHYAVLDAVVRFRVEKGRRALEVTLTPATRAAQIEGKG